MKNTKLLITYEVWGWFCVLLSLMFTIFIVKIGNSNSDLIKENEKYEKTIEELTKENKTQLIEYNILKEKYSELEIMYTNNECENITLMQELIEPLKETDAKNWYIMYKKIMENYSDIGCSDTIYNYYNEEEINMMLRVIETETYGAPFDAKVNVANVILARIESENFPIDPIEIITSPNQFAYHRTNIVEDTVLALEYAFEIGTEHNDCIAFRSDSCPNKWNNWEYIYTDGYHYFYK